MAGHSTKISTASFHYAAVNFKMKVLPRLYLCNELRHDTGLSTIMLHNESELLSV